TEGAQHVDGGAIAAPGALGQLAAVAEPHHLCAAGLVGAGLARQMMQIFRVGGIGDIDDRRAVGLGPARRGIDRRRYIVRSAVMADIGDPAIALMMDGRLIGTARLQVVPADQAHVRSLGWRSNFLLLGLGCAGRDQEADDEQCLPRHGVPPWGVSPWFPVIIRGRTAAATALTAPLSQPHFGPAMSVETLLLFFLAC